MILSIDTSLAILSIAILRDGIPAAALSLEGEGSRNEKLLPAIDWLIREAGVERSSLSQLVVTRGPGSFTGVRIGLATAQGIAFSLGVPIAAMSTHEAVADAGPGSLLVFAGAGRGEFYVSGFREGREVLAPALATEQEIEVLRGDFERSVDLDRESRRRCVALLAALRFCEAGEAERSRWRDATPIYVRASEADVRMAQRLAAERDPA